jgi:hypothetical protein
MQDSTQLCFSELYHKGEIMSRQKRNHCAGFKTSFSSLFGESVRTFKRKVVDERLKQIAEELGADLLNPSDFDVCVELLNA